jgi:hypothetical protein
VRREYRGILCARVAFRTESVGRSASPLGVVNKRIALAFAAAPLVSAVLYAISALAASRLTLPGEFWFTIGIAYAYGLVGTLALALPAFLIAKRFGVIRWWSACIAGAALGYMFSLLIANPLLIGIGAVAGMTFWAIARSDTTPNNRLSGRGS